MSERVQALQAEVRCFVAAHRVDGLDALPAHAAHDALPSTAVAAWTDALREGRWLCISWPERFGGRGLSLLELVAVDEAFAALGAPRIVLGIAERLVAPTLLLHGNEEQQERFLPGILAGERWCQGFSEPDAGSDLASLRTRGRVEGDELVIDGQKIWTSEANHADWCLVLCRTDPDAPRHAGLSLVAVPVRQPGITVRPLRQAHGASGFNEVFLDGARAPLSNVIGGLGGGWKAATSTLAAERASEAMTMPFAYEREWCRLVNEASARHRLCDTTVRRGLVDAYARIKLLRWSSQRQYAVLLAGRDPGPFASLYKVLASEHHRAFGDTAVRVLGADALLVDGDEPYAVGPWQRIFFESRSRCISRGTNEIQRNVIAERVLGLPRG